MFYNYNLAFDFFHLVFAVSEHWLTQHD